MDSELNINLNDILEGQKESLRLTAIQALKDSVTKQIGWDLSGAVSEATKKFIAEEITPELLKLLQAEKENILKQLSNLVGEVGEELKKALVKKAVDNLTSSWRVTDIGKQLFQ